ncbi:hypothetical protein [Delftia sp. PS-11]|uniref:hypothetical protein n=1 Tax=Delftia sp. PS-11 TaxID=2767222 RepID=UPI002455B650|nr:hypothetical protein [Delftia sp. PS-11]KAJ8741798.1 hypothetical protein H9T68_20770 [Delftia sp. PS-11]
MNTEQIAADIAGMQVATAAVLQALIATHPNMAAFRAQLALEQQSSLAYLTAMPIPDRSLTAFQLMLDMCLAAPVPGARTSE